MTSISNTALNRLHARLKAAVADLPDDCQPSHVVSVIVDLLAWRIARTVTSQNIEILTTEIARSLHRRVTHHQDQVDQAEFVWPSPPDKETVQ
jgi:hypothetical protein